MTLPSIDALIDAGVHLGHRASRWNPKMRPYIWGKKNLIHVMDLRQTLKGLIRASHFLSSIVEAGEEVIFVGTKRQAREVILQVSQQLGMHRVVDRWLGGTLTNFMTIRERLKRLQEIEAVEASGVLQTYTKKMVAAVYREKRKILRNLEGIRHMERLPQAVVVVDPLREHIGVAEANRLGIPVVALMDTDCDPDRVEIVVPGNDDAYRSIQLVLECLGSAIMEGKARGEERKRQAEREAADSYAREQLALAKKEAEDERRQAAVVEARAASAEGQEVAGETLQGG